MGSEDKKKIKDEDKRMLYISILMVVLLAIVSYWRFTTSDFSNISFSSPVTKDANRPSLQDMLSDEGLEKMMRESGLLSEEKGEVVNYKRETLEGKIVFDYPSSWEKLPSVQKRTENIEMLFFAYSQEIIYSTTVALFKVQAKDIEAATSIIKEETEERKQSEFSIEKSGEEYLLEVNYGLVEEPNTLSRGKVFHIDDYFYFFVITFFENHPPDEAVINYVISSVQVIE